MAIVVDEADLAVGALVCLAAVDGTELAEEEALAPAVLASGGAAAAVVPDERTISLKEILNWPGCVVAIDEALDELAPAELATLAAG